MLRLMTLRWFRSMVLCSIAVTSLSVAIVSVQLLMVPNVTRVLILGMDCIEGNPTARGFNSDTMLILEINKRTHNLVLYQIPRDTMVYISPQTGLDKANVSLIKVGPRRTCRTIGRLAGCRIDHYVVLTIPDFVALIDATGGIRVRIPRRNLTDSQLDLMHGKETVLHGVEALQFVRGRPDSDTLRQGRQEAFATEFIKSRRQVRPCELARLAKWLWNLDTDISLMQWAAYARIGRGCKVTRRTLSVSSIYLNGISYVLPGRPTERQPR